MYRLLIVDDEPEIVDWLYDLFYSQTQLDLELLKAYSAKQAIAHFTKLKIDIVLSDIKMPGMTGIQLLEQIKQNWPQCRVIFLTGYQDFQNIYEAIQNKAVNYLLKTEKDEKIIQAVVETMDEMSRSLDTQYILKKAKTQIERYLPVLQVKFVQELLDGIVSRQDLTQGRFDELDIPLKADLPVLLLVGKLDSLHSHGSYIENENILQVIKTISENNMPGNCCCYCLVSSRRHLVWLIQSVHCTHNEISSGDDIELLVKVIPLLKGSVENIQAACLNMLQATISFAIAGSPCMAHEIAEKYTLLASRIEVDSGHGKERIYVENNWTEPNGMLNPDKAYQDLYKQINKLFLMERYFDENRAEECFVLMNQMTGLITAKECNSNCALELYYNVATLFLRYINRRNMLPKIRSRIEIQKLSDYHAHYSFVEAFCYLQNVAEAIFSIISENNEDGTSNTITKLQHFIRNHLADDLSQTRLSDLVNLNPSYLSRLYKQYTGKNLIDYINEQRITRAKALLRQGNIKVFEIAAEVGYESQQSFTRFFKNIVGTTPQDYKETF